MLSFDERCLTSGAVRREAIRAVRDAMAWSRPRVERVPNVPRRGVFRVIAGLFHDLEMSLMAISQSLADGVGYASGEDMPMRPQPMDSASETHVGDTEPAAPIGDAEPVGPCPANDDRLGRDLGADRRQLAGL